MCTLWVGNVMTPVWCLSVGRCGFLTEGCAEKSDVCLNEQWMTTNFPIENTNTYEQQGLGVEHQTVELKGNLNRIHSWDGITQYIWAI